MITPINNHAVQTVALLLEQFKGKANFKKLVDVLVAPLQECEDVAWQLYGFRNLSAAVGTQLDFIGDIFAVPRAGQLDTEYRSAIRLKIYEIGTSGTPDELMTVLKAVTDSDAVTYMPVFPASIQMSADAEELPPDILEFMTRLAPGGVALWLFAFAGLLPFGPGGESEQDLLLVNGDYLEIEAGGDLLFVSGAASSVPRNDAGTFCDMDSEGNFYTDETSGRAFDVLQAA